MAAAVFSLTPSEDVIILASSVQITLSHPKVSSMKRFFCGMVALGLFGHLTGPAKADYFYAPIDFPGSTVTQALGINNAGQIVGRYASRDLGHGFLLSQGTYTALDVPSSLGGPLGVDFTIATGINAAGQI